MLSSIIDWRNSERLITFFYFICIGQQKAGAIRIVDTKENGKNKRISPIFILPEFQGKGIAQKAIRLCEKMHGNENWELDTILQEPKNCHLYEKMGYRQTGRTKVINEIAYSSGSFIAKAFKAHSEQGAVFNPSSALLQSVRKK